MGKKEVGVAIVKELAKDIYQDGLQPATKEIGKALGTIVGLANAILLPVEIANKCLGYKAKEFLADLEPKIENIPEEKRQEPPLMIAGPVLEGLKYNDNEDLREMFLNLLAASMNSDTAENAHPSYVETIKQLSPLDAKIFREIYLAEQFACVHLNLRIKGTERVYTDAFPDYFLNELYNLADPFLMSSSIQNIIRLGLINYLMKIQMMGYNYSKIRENPYVLDRIEHYNQYEKEVFLDIINGTIQINNYGKNFAKICLL